MRPVEEAWPDSMQLPFLYAYLKHVPIRRRPQKQTKKRGLRTGLAKGARVHPRSRSVLETPNVHRCVPQQRA